MKILLQYLKPLKWLVLLSLLCATVNQVFSMLDPVLMGRLLNTFVVHPHEVGYMNDQTHEFVKVRDRSQQEFIQGVLWILLQLIGVAMVSRIGKAFQDYFVSVVVQKFGAKIFTDGLRHSMKLPFSDFEDQRSGETLAILQKVRTDTEKFITAFVNVVFAALVGIVFVSIYSVNTDYRVILVFLAGAVVLSLITSLLSKKIKVIQKMIVKETTALAGTTTESLRNIELVKSLGLTGQEIERLNSNTYKILGLEIRKVKSVRALSFIQGTCVNFLRQCIIFLLVWLVFGKALDPGHYLTFTFFSFFIFGPLQEIGNIILYYREAEASLQNFDTLMKKPAEPQPLHPEKVGPIEELRFEQLTFKHKTASYNALEEVSFNVKRGETIAFVGPSGAGKSTLVKMLVGLYLPQKGRVLFNGVDDDNINFDELRNQIGFVTQDTQLFAGTIKENLLFVNPSATDEEIRNALYKANCQNLLAKAEKDIETVIGEGGLKLSGGEKQRLSIARALLRKPRLLIFDEATSALDSLTEEAITRTIKEISAQREQITVLIAHRLSTIMHADRIYVLEKGRVAETGTHEDLLSEKGLYYAMWRQQIGERKNTTITA
jgi:ATP-binding cassette, subfamily B, bacterial